MRLRLRNLRECFRLRLYLSRAPGATPVIDDYHKPSKAVQKHDGVGGDKDPVANQPTVDSKAQRSRHLADKEPFRNALARSFPPLPVHLLCNRQHENTRAEPP